MDLSSSWIADSATLNFRFSWSFPCSSLSSSLHSSALCRVHILCLCTIGMPRCLWSRIFPLEFFVVVPFGILTLIRLRKVLYFVIYSKDLLLIFGWRVPFSCSHQQLVFAITIRESCEISLPSLYSHFFCLI